MWWEFWAWENKTSVRILSKTWRYSYIIIFFLRVHRVCLIKTVYTLAYSLILYSNSDYIKLDYTEER